MVDKLVNSEINAKRISNVEGCFGISGVPLSVPGRVLVGEGVLTKICRKKPKSRQFFLFNDILVYGTIIINKKKYTQQHIIPLEDLTVEDLPDEIVMKNGWLIKTSSKSFAVYAGSQSEKAEWIRHIRKCANDLLEQTGRSAIQVHAAVWVPDSMSRVCMHCHQTQFTMINRRHHCRKCGSVICGNCSKNRVVILHQSNSPVRVCDTCYNNFNNHLNKIKKAATDGTNLSQSSSLISSKTYKHQFSGSEDESIDRNLSMDNSYLKDESMSNSFSIEKTSEISFESEETNQRDNISSHNSVDKVSVEPEKLEKKMNVDLKDNQNENHGIKEHTNNIVEKNKEEQTEILINQSSDSEDEANDIFSSGEDNSDKIEPVGKPTFYEDLDLLKNEQKKLEETKIVVDSETKAENNRKLSKEVLI